MLFAKAPQKKKLFKKKFEVQKRVSPHMSCFYFVGSVGCAMASTVAFAATAERLFVSSCENNRKARRGALVSGVAFVSLVAASAVLATLGVKELYTTPSH